MKRVKTLHWMSLRRRTIEHLIGDTKGVQSLALQIVSVVRQFQCHPMSIAQLKQVVHSMLQKKAKRYSKFTVANFMCVLPAPDLPEYNYNSNGDLTLVSQGLPRVNAYSIDLEFIYDLVKGTFKVEALKMMHDTTQHINKLVCYSAGRMYHTMIRTATNSTEMQEDTFLYYLRDLVGTMLCHIKRQQPCGRLKLHMDNYLVRCGRGVRFQGASCRQCLSNSLEEIYNTI